MKLDALEMVEMLSELPEACVHLKRRIEHPGRPRTKVYLDFEDRFGSPISLLYSLKRPTSISFNEISLIYRNKYSLEFQHQINNPLLVRSFLDVLANDPTPSEIAHSEMFSDLESEGGFNFSYTGRGVETAFLQDQVLLEAGTEIFDGDYVIDSIKDPNAYYCRETTEGYEEDESNYEYFDRWEIHRSQIPKGSLVFYKKIAGVTGIGRVIHREYSEHNGNQYLIGPGHPGALVPEHYLIAILKWEGEDVS